MTNAIQTQIPENAQNTRPVRYGTQFELAAEPETTYIACRINGKIERYAIQDGLEIFTGYV